MTALVLWTFGGLWHTLLLTPIRGGASYCCIGLLLLQSYSLFQWFGAANCCGPMAYGYVAMLAIAMIGGLLIGEHPSMPSDQGKSQDAFLDGCPGLPDKGRSDTFIGWVGHHF